MEASQIYKQVKDGQDRVLKIAAGVVRVFESYYGPFYYPPGYDSISKLYSIQLYGCGKELWPFLKDLNYSYAAELQTVFAIMDKLVRNHMSVVDAVDWNCLYSINNLKRLGEKYILDTKEGTIVTTPLTRYQENREVYKFANKNYYRGVCHETVESFIRKHKEYQAVTSLMPYQFGRNHYHSYVKKEGKIFDFSHNVCAEEDNYNQVMKPIPLNEIYGYELESEEKKFRSDDIGGGKNLIFRLAVAKQKRMYDKSS